MALPIIEPFRIKSVEPIRRTTRDERQGYLREAHHNVFFLRARDVLIDLLTDSGCSAMSSRQWSALMQGDESYAGAESYYHLKRVVEEITGHEHVIPTHQGRAAERILFQLIGGEGAVLISNTFFDTTRANIEFSGATAIDCVTTDADDFASDLPFKGNMNLERLEELLAEHGDRVTGCVVTVTNNSRGGQPVSMANVRATRDLCRRFEVPLYLDSCRFAENAWFIKTREDGYRHKSCRQIAREMFDLVDGATFSGKKDALANMGGFLTLRDAQLTERSRALLTITEGFPTYGGMSGRDLEAMAAGLEEVLDEDYLAYRIASIAWTARGIHAKGIPVVLPPGGHAVYIDARRWLSHISPARLPGVALINALYVEYGIRAVEIGTLMFGTRDPDTGELRPGDFDLVRMAIPRRAYTQSHMEYVVEALGELAGKIDALPGYRIVHEPPFLRHFTARLEPMSV